MTTKRRAEPLLWLLFTSGGLAAAMLIPVLMVGFGLAIPAGWVPAPTQGHLLAVARFPLTRVVLLVVFILALSHWAHRFRYTLYDGLKLKRLAAPIIVVCYGGALAGSAFAAYVLIAGV